MLKDNARRIGLLLSLIGAISCSRARDTQVPVSVLVYNIHAGKDAKGVDNLERVAGIIRDSRADIVLLQEVDRLTKRSGNVDQAARLKELTGFYGVFGKTIDWQGGEYGIAVLSRWKIGDDTIMRLFASPLRRSPSFEARGALSVQILAPFGMLRVVNTHLDASRADSFRVMQAKELPVSSPVTILGGDFNAEPASEPYKLVLLADWRDAFTICGRGDGLSFPDDTPIKRIDFLFLRPEMSCIEARVIDTRASDHRPVFVKFGYPVTNRN